MSNISKAVFFASAGVPAEDSYSGLTEVSHPNPTISIVVISGQREAMLSALQLVFGGTPNVQAELLARDEATPVQSNEKKLASNQCQPSAFDLGLTERQFDVLALMMQGKSNKAICRVLNLAEPTVKNHVSGILTSVESLEPDRGSHCSSRIGLEIVKRIATRSAIENPVRTRTMRSDTSTAAGVSGHACISPGVPSVTTLAVVLAVEPRRSRRAGSRSFRFSG